MPFFRTTHNIFKDKGEHFDPNWMDSNKLELPPQTHWDYKRELQIEDINLWEVIFEGGFGVYAAWDPYAEFYMLIHPLYHNKDIEVFYGRNANKRIRKRMKELGIPFYTHKAWVEPEDMWLYSD